MKEIANWQKINQIEIPASIQALIGSMFIATCAQISIPLPFTPVPLTGQTFGVMLVGALLGSKTGASAALLYLVQGSVGLPVWAGGAFGIHCLFGPTGGYLLAYPVQAYLVGALLEKGRGFWAIIFGSIVQLTLGSLWLAHFVGLKSGFTMGFCPFIGVEIVKVYFATIFYRRKHDSHH